MHYNRLALVVVLANLVAWWAWFNGSAERAFVVAQVNLALAVLVRNQYVVNFISSMVVRAPVTWPLSVRRVLGKVYHMGGLHVGAAVAGTAWYCVFVLNALSAASQGAAAMSRLNAGLSITFFLLLLSIVVMAHPWVRVRMHDCFEFTHRFLGWSALIVGWLNALLLIAAQSNQGSAIGAILASPICWLLAVTSLSSALPWLMMRKVPIHVKMPSRHVAVVSFDHGVTAPIGSVRAISRHPLFGWHTFGCVPAVAANSGYRMLISRAGDWTGAFIDHPPSHVWIRGTPVIGMANVRKLFRKVLFGATGSGIGPMLSHLLVNEVPSHLVWITREPRKTYGDELVDEILSVQPSALIWNTDELGKPDVLRLVYAAYREHDAEAVICVANSKVTWQVVHGLERCGIPAFGPIWDS